MNCYRHPEVPAVGICKNCSKGLCHDCVSEVPNGIACTDTCEEEAIALNNAIQKTKLGYGRTGKAYFRIAIMYLVFGVVFSIISYGAFLSEEDRGVLLITIPFTLAFFYGAYGNYQSSKKIDTTES